MQDLQPLLQAVTWSAQNSILSAGSVQTVMFALNDEEQKVYTNFKLK